MKKILLLCCVYFFACRGYSQTDSIEVHARQLLELTGTARLGDQMIDNLVATFKTEMPSVPADFWEEFQKQVNTKEMVDLLVPVYCKYYTNAEILQMIDFYKTPLGLKIVEKSPMISQDSYSMSQAWGRKMAEMLELKLRSKGYIQRN